MSHLWISLVTIHFSFTLFYNKVILCLFTVVLFPCIVIQLCNVVIDVAIFWF